MPLVHVVLGLALLEFVVFCYAVGRARIQYNVPAPATTGNEMFERYYRVQMNTLEQLVVFVPALLLFARYVDPYWGAGLGALFVIGRAVYFQGYVAAPARRHIGFMIGAVPNMLLLLGAVVGAVRAALLRG
jgi:glutathione S-transferase